MDRIDTLEISETKSIEDIFGLPEDEINAIFIEADRELTPDEEAEQEKFYKQMQKEQK